MERQSAACITGRSLNEPRWGQTIRRGPDTYPLGSVNEINQGF